MSTMDPRTIVPRPIAALAIVLLGAALAACQSSAGKGAAQGAGTGAIAGAVGGAVTALVFGGDPVEAAARSAVWGASAGAATGAIAGSQADSQAKKQAEQKSHAETEAELAKLREEIGEENFAGLASLADCKHDESLKAAAKGKRSNNPNHALAGLWLEILNYADSGREPKARDLFPTLVKQDWNIETTAQAETKMREGITALGNIREEYDRPRVCAT